jgi:hypothetical protein
MQEEPSLGGLSFLKKLLKVQNLSAELEGREIVTVSLMGTNLMAS